MKRNIFIILGIIIIAMFVQHILSNAASFQRLELMSYDLRSRLISDDSPLGKKFNHADKDIVIVGIDDYSLKKLKANSLKTGSEDWQDGVWKKILNFVEEGDPKVVMFDMVFEKLNDEPWYNRSFANHLMRYDNVVLGTYVDNPILKENKFSKEINLVKNDYIPTGKSLEVSTDNRKLDSAITYTKHSPVNTLYAEHNIIGVINSSIDDDFRIRKNQPIFKLVQNNESYYMPSLAFAGFMRYLGDDSRVTIRSNKLYYKDRVIPLNPDGTVNMNLHKFGQCYTYIPVSKILLNKGRRRDLKPEFFKDKLVIIGKTASGANLDLSSIIHQSYMSPEANATALDNYINDSYVGKTGSRRFVSEMSKPLQVLITILACVLIAVIGLVSKSAFIGCINGFFSIVAYILFSIWLFVNPSSRLMMPIIVPIYYLAVTSGVVFAYRFYKEITRKNVIMNTFGKFVSPNVLSKVLKNSDVQKLKSTKKRITVMFCDVKDFSKLSEKHNPEKLVSNLNDLFKEIVNIIFENDGTVDKFIGDCIMAYWGDVGDSQDSEYKAVKTALRIKKKINELKIKNAKENKIIFDVKIGINTGDAILGLAGTDKIMCYTAMGDAVNTASRLESACSSVNRDILIAKSTYEPVKDQVVVLDVGKIEIKGKEEPINAYEPIGLTEEIKAENEKF